MPSYATEEGALGAGADPDEALAVMPPSRGSARPICFFLGMASGGPSLLLSGSLIAAVWKARSREHIASFSSQGTVMTPPLPGILRTLYLW